MRTHTDKIAGFWLDSIRRRHWRCVRHAPKLIPWNVVTSSEAAELTEASRCDVCGVSLRPSS
jgi:hypothetical protein